MTTNATDVQVANIINKNLRWKKQNKLFLNHCTRKTKNNNKTVSKLADQFIKNIYNSLNQVENILPNL